MTATDAPAGDRVGGGELRIGAWTLDAHHNELRRDGESTRLEPKAIEVLAHLARHAGTAVSREELLTVVWPGVVVGDDALTQAIIKLRKALGDDAHNPTYIETISKRGYRLIAPVAGATPPVPAAPAPKAASSPRTRYAIALAVVLAIGVAIAIPFVGKSLRMPWPIGADTRGASTGLPTVAVLPLENLSGDPKREYFSDGMTEDIINALGRFSGMRVISRGAVQAFKGKAPAPQAIRKEMDVRYLVQGSVRDADGRIRVAIELSDTENGAQLWSERYEGGGAQLFEIQDQIARDIVGKLHVRLSHLEEARTRALPPESLEAHDLVLRARYLLYRGERSANREARALLTRAMEIAPGYAQAYATMGSAEFQRATDGFVEDAADATRRAEEITKRTLTFPDERAHASAHSTLAAIYSHLNRPEEALAHADRAIELNPSDHRALYWRGAALLYVGRMDEAIAVLETARRYEPYPSAGAALNLSLAYFAVGRYADTLAHTDALLARNPRNVFLHAMRAAALGQLGRLDEAARAADDVRRSNPAFQPDNFGARFADPRYTAMVRDGLRKAGL